MKDGDLLVFEEESKRDSILPQKIDLVVLYEDDYMLAVDKPPYVVVHPTKTHNEGTLANAVRYYFDEKGISEPVRFFNRIDMGTSGIVLLPKTSEVHSLLDRRCADTMIKKYIAVVSGILGNKKGRIELPISNEADPQGRRYISDQGKYASTEYEVLEEYAHASLLSVTIETGKTHQIRIHLSSIGHPLFGDMLYGGDNAIIKRQALHASELNFTHPVNEEHVTIKSQLPRDILMLLKELKGEKRIEGL